MCFVTLSLCEIMQYFKMEIWEFILWILNSIRLKKNNNKTTKKKQKEKMTGICCMSAGVSNHRWGEKLA